MSNQNRVQPGVPTGGQYAATVHSDGVPSLGTTLVRSPDPVVDPTHPWRPYTITQDEDGEFHYDEVRADWAMQQKEPVTRSEIIRALSCPRLAGRQGRIVDLGYVPGRRNSENDDHYDVVGPASGAPLVIRIHDGFHLLHVRSGNVQIEVIRGFGGGVTIHDGAEAGVVVDGDNKYAITIEGTGRARVGLSEKAQANVRNEGTGASYVTGGGKRCTLTAGPRAIFNQDGPEENRLPVNRPVTAQAALA
jgi:hypothetical protein